VRGQGSRSAARRCDATRAARAPTPRGCRSGARWRAGASCAARAPRPRRRQSGLSFQVGRPPTRLLQDNASVCDGTRGRQQRQPVAAHGVGPAGGQRYVPPLTLILYSCRQWQPVAAHGRKPAGGQRHVLRPTLNPWGRRQRQPVAAHGRGPANGQHDVPRQHGCERRGCGRARRRPPARAGARLRLHAGRARRGRHHRRAGVQLAGSDSSHGCSCSLQESIFCDR